MEATKPDDLQEDLMKILETKPFMSLHQMRKAMHAKGKTPNAPFDSAF